MLMMWKIQPAVEDDVIRATLFPCCFLPANRDQVFIWQNFPACLLRSCWKNRDLRNGASLSSHMNMSEILDLDWILVKRHLDGKLTSFCLNRNYPAYSDLLAFTGELLTMKRWLPLLRD